jgi:hypothetical protein
MTRAAGPVQPGYCEIIPACLESAKPSHTAAWMLYRARWIGAPRVGLPPGGYEPPGVRDLAFLKPASSSHWNAASKRIERRLR